MEKTLQGVFISTFFNKNIAFLAENEYNILTFCFDL